jgi:hypothetical protein
MDAYSKNFIMRMWWWNANYNVDKDIEIRTKTFKYIVQTLKNIQIHSKTFKYTKNTTKTIKCIINTFKYIENTLKCIEIYWNMLKAHWKYIEIYYK